MADEFQTEICSGNWWNSARNTLNGGVSLPCSTSINEMGISFGWPNSTEMAIEANDCNNKGRSCDQESSSAVSVSGSSIVLQDAQKPQGLDSVSDGGGSSTVLMDSTLQMMGFPLSSSNNMDWSQAFLSRSSGRTDQSNFHSMLQEDLNSRQNYQQDQARNIESVQGFALDHQHGSSSSESTVTCQGLPAAATSFSLDNSSVSYGSYPSTLLQGLLLDQSDLQTPQAMNYPPIASSSTSYGMIMNEFSPPWSRFPQFLKTSSSPPKQQQIGNNNQLHFSNNTPYWNASAASSTNSIRSSFYPSSSQPQLLTPSFEAAKVPNNLTLKPKAEVRDSSSVVKKSSGEPANKRARVDTPSPLPTFKVRKEKLGDRITALQQLVSPFGKTDTASVLFEAIEYVKFLHEQVSVLSVPYLKNGAAIQQQQQQQQQQSSDKSKDGEGAQPDLRSRGLCLVPISSTFPVTNETTADFWTPTFGGTYR